jgi:hypothetical protein
MLKACSSNRLHTPREASASVSPILLEGVRAGGLSLAGRAGERRLDQVAKRRKKSQYAHLMGVDGVEPEISVATAS